MDQIQLWDTRYSFRPTCNGKTSNILENVQSRDAAVQSVTRALPMEHPCSLILLSESPKSTSHRRHFPRLVSLSSPPKPPSVLFQVASPHWSVPGWLAPGSAVTTSRAAPSLSKQTQSRLWRPGRSSYGQDSTASMLGVWS